MTPKAANSPPTIARVLNVLLIVIIIILGLSFLAMLCTSVLLQFPNVLNENIIGKLEATGGEMPTRTQLSLTFLVAAIMPAAYLYVAFVVRAIVKSTFIGDPFVEANISRLRKTWIVIALVEIFQMFIMSRLPGAPANPDVALNSFSVNTQLSAWFLVFVIAAMAEVFRIGLELRRDQELTV